MLVLAVLPDPGDADRAALRKHVRGALAEVIGPLQAHTHAAACLQGRLAENVDAVLGRAVATTEPYKVAIVVGARLFMALAMLLQPSVRPTKFVVFLGADDAEKPPAPPPARRQWWRAHVCACGASAQPLPMAPALLPAEPQLRVLFIDTTGGELRQPWIDYVATALGHERASTGLYRWQSSLTSGDSGAARDGARILDFIA